jgi:predicted metal-dependent hydrolase
VPDEARCVAGIIGSVNLRSPAWDPSLGDDVVIRESARSRRLLLRVHESAQVEIVVPTGTPLRLVEQFVASHLEWIAVRVAKARARARPPEAFPPETIDLVALGERWRVECLPGTGPARATERGEECILLRGDDSTLARQAALRRWVVRRAQAVLPEWLAEVSALHGFRYEDCQVRLQRTRWGSCSSRGLINLNAALLFQRPDVLRYLLVHELSHTRHMDHSNRFWAVVAECEPGYRQLDAQLRRGWRNVPDWLRPRRKVMS